MPWPEGFRAVVRRGPPWPMTLAFRSSAVARRGQ